MTTLSTDSESSFQSLPHFPSAWTDFLATHPTRYLEFQKTLAQCESFVKTAAQGQPIVPQADNLYQAFSLCPPQNLKAVIIGQDPYPGTYADCFGQMQPLAMGLSFSVPPEAKTPASLRNIYACLEKDLGICSPNHGDLTSWAEQGVLLLNTCLTTALGAAGAHSKSPWPALTQLIVNQLIADSPFETGAFSLILWGKHAQGLLANVPPVPKEVLVIESGHPSPLGQPQKSGFFEHKPFSRTNAHLQSFGRTPVDWVLPDHNQDLPLFSLF